MTHLTVSVTNLTWCSWHCYFSRAVTTSVWLPYDISISSIKNETKRPYQQRTWREGERERVGCLVYSPSLLFLCVAGGRGRVPWGRGCQTPPHWEVCPAPDLGAWSEMVMSLVEKARRTVTSSVCALHRCRRAEGLGGHRVSVASLRSAPPNKLPEGLWALRFAGAVPPTAATKKWGKKIWSCWV